MPLKDIVRETADVIERLCIEAALKMTGDNRASAAEMLGLSRQSLYVKLRRYGLAESGRRTEAKSSVILRSARIMPRACPAPRPLLELLKPITWFPPMWAFGCGVVSSGLSTQQRWPVIAAGVACSPGRWCAAPVRRSTTGTTATSTRSTSRGARFRRAASLAAGVSTSRSAGPRCRCSSRPRSGTWGFAAAVAGLALAWAYSAPPLRLKQNGWWGNSAVAACYEGLPWFTGAAVMAAALPDWRDRDARRCSTASARTAS